MATTTVTIRIDEKLKKEAEDLFEDMGMNMTTAFTIFAKAAVRENRIPFEISRDPFYSRANQKPLRESLEQLNAGNRILNVTSIGGLLHIKQI